MNIKSHVKLCIEKQLNKKYEKEISQRHEDYNSWIQRIEKESSLDGNLDSSYYTMLPTKSGYYAKDVEKYIHHYFQKHQDTLIVYGDEDLLDEKEEYRIHPWFKPDWSPHTFSGFNYLGNPVAIRNTLIKQCGYEGVKITQSNRYEILKCCIEQAGGFQIGCKKIGHIERILFHGKSFIESQNPYYFEKYQDMHNDDDKISIVIPSKDNPQVLRRCIMSIIETKNDRRIEILIVDNGSNTQNKDEIEKFILDLTFVKYIYVPMEFNFSKMCNIGARKAEGKYLLFLNDDTLAKQAGWLDYMVEFALQDSCGAVGMKLLYPNGKQIQHAGIVNLPLGPVHKLQFLSDANVYEFQWNRLPRNVLAVTGACLMIRHDLFIEVEGFPEDLAIAFNDVSLCFKLYERGYHNVVRNDSYLYHYESLSRGDDESSEKWNRLMHERDILYKKFPNLIGWDPYYSKYLNRCALDTRILPGNEDIAQKPEIVQWKALRNVPKYHRLDECVHIRFEYVTLEKIQGYVVVLGSNNACYKKTLILKRIKNGEECVSMYGYQIHLPKVYRSDLQENMKDQKNVALSGFCITFKEPIEPGKYVLGVMAENCITKERILNFSQRILLV